MIIEIEFYITMNEAFLCCQIHWYFQISPTFLFSLKGFLFINAFQISNHFSQIPPFKRIRDRTYFIPLYLAKAYHQTCGMTIKD